MKDATLDDLVISAAADCIAAAAAGGRRPVLCFAPDNLKLVDAGTLGTDWSPHRQLISVPAPVTHSPFANVMELALDRLQRAVVAQGYRTLRFPRFSGTQFRRAAQAIAATAERLHVPSDWVAFRAEDLREITQRDLVERSSELRARQIIWVPLAGLPRTFPAARFAGAGLLCRELASRAEASNLAEHQADRSRAKETRLAA